MSRFILSFFGGISGALIKWALIAVLWIGSIVFVATSALALDAISDAMMRFAGIPTLRLDQKRKVAMAKTELRAQKNQTARAKNRLNEERALRKRAIKAHSTKVNRFVSRLAARNISDAGTSLIPLAGGLMSVTFAVADVYAACEMVDMQNDLNMAFSVEDELSGFESVCVNSVEQVDALGQQAEAKLAEMKRTGQQISGAVGEWKEQIPSSGDMSDYLAKQMCRVTGDC